MFIQLVLHRKKKMEVDFDALNKYVVEKAGPENREVLVGVVSGLIDLGTKHRRCIGSLYFGSEEDEIKGNC